MSTSRLTFVVKGDRSSVFGQAFLSLAVLGLTWDRSAGIGI